MFKRGCVPAARAQHVSMAALSGFSQVLCGASARAFVAPLTSISSALLPFPCTSTAVAVLAPPYDVLASVATQGGDA